MNQTGNKREVVILEALKKCAPSARRLSGGRWSMVLANGKSFGVTVHAAEEWLMLDAPLIDRVGRDELWSLLRVNASLDGPVKLVLMPDNRSVHARADVLWLEEQACECDLENGADEELSARLLEACRLLTTAFERFAQKQTPRCEPSPSRIEGQTAEPEDLKVRCADSEWPFIERSTGTLVFDLEAPGGFFQAAVERRSAGVRISVELASWNAMGELGRQALAALLLKTGGRVRLARPAVDEDEGRISARFDIGFFAAPSAGELKHALSCLSVACALSGREARIIDDEFVAGKYLTIGAPGSAAVPAALP